MTQTLSQLENSGAFIERHIGPDAAQQQEMLNAVGAQSLNALTGQIVPKDIQLATPPQVGAPATEYAALAELKAIASRNKRFTSYIGMGYTAVHKQIKTLLFFIIFIIRLAGRESITNVLPVIGVTELVIFSISTSPPVIPPKRT